MSVSFRNVSPLLWRQFNIRQIHSVRQLSVLSKCASAMVSPNSLQRRWCKYEQRRFKHVNESDGHVGVELVNASPQEAFALLVFQEKHPSLFKILKKIFKMWSVTARATYHISGLSKGAGAAVCHISKCLAENQAEELEDVMPSELLSSLSEAVQELGDNRNRLIFTENDIGFIVINGSRDYEDKEKRTVEVDIIFCIMDDSKAEGQTGNEFVRMLLMGGELERILKLLKERNQAMYVRCTFVREMVDRFFQPWTIKNLQYSLISIEQG